jgi:hypothetical protein
VSIFSKGPTDHRINPLNKQLEVERGQAGEYLVHLPPAEGAVKGRTITLQFHAGSSSAPRGLTNEVLLAIVIDRLRRSQNDKTAATSEAYAALNCLSTALMWLSQLSRRMLGEE